MLRGLFAHIVRAFLRVFVRLLPAPRVIYDREGGSPYLSRWYLLGARRDNDGRLVNERSWLAKLPVNIFIHRFHRSDDDGALHSHPWHWSFSLVLAGGYSEERRVGDAVVRRTVAPFSINRLRAEDYHRVELLEQDAWSIFIAGPKCGTWYFWDRHLKCRATWRDFIAHKRGDKADASWERDKRSVA